VLPDIRGLGVMAFDPIWAEREHTSSGYELLHIVRGTVRLELGGHSYVGRPGDTLLVPPRTRHRDRFDLAEGLEVFFCAFHWPAAPGAFRRVTNARLLAAAALVRGDISAAVDQLRADDGRGAEADRLVAGARLLTLLMILLRACAPRSPVRATPRAAQTRRQALMRQARAYLEAHYAEPVTLDAIAEALHVSPYHLSHVFSAENDFTLFDCLTRLRMDKARLLLREGRGAVGAVARAVGYADPNYFAKVFKRHCGRRPRDVARAAR
jgi:AraC-like DNA-binding protein